MNPDATRKRFATELRARLEAIEQQLVSLVQRESQRLTQCEEADPLRMTIARSLGKALHDFYDALESWIFKRICEEAGDDIRAGSRYHQVLLESMTLEVEGVRRAVLKPNTCQSLKDYLGFRHVFRHVYGEGLELDELRELAESLAGVWQSVRAEVEEFLGRL